MGSASGLFFAGKMGFHVLELRFIRKKTIENGNRLKFKQDEDRICALRQWDLVTI